MTTASFSPVRLLLALGVLVALGAPPALGQVPGLSTARRDVKAEAPPTAFSIEETRNALAAARRQLESIEAAGENPSDVPVNTPQPEILQRLTLARMLASTYEKQLNALQKAEEARARLAAAQKASEAWQGFDSAPPFSVLLVDQLRDALDASRSALASAKATSALFQRLEADYGARLKASQGAARLAAEAADRARGTPAHPQREWEHSLAALRAQADSAVQALLQIGRKTANTEVEAAETDAALAARQLAAIGTAVDLPRADLDKMLAEIESRRRGAEKSLAAAVRASEAAVAALSRAERRQAEADGASPAAGTAAPSPPSAELARETAAAREAVATANQRVFLLREYLLQLDGEKAAWEARFGAFDMHDPVRARAAYDRLSDSMAGLKATKQYLEQQLAVADARLRDEEARQRAAMNTDTPASKQMIDALRQRQADLRKSLDDSAPLTRLSAHFRADFEDRRESSFAARMADRAAAVRLAARDAWNYELFAIDDSFETAEGRKIAVSRSVTVGKTFGAALIVVVGYWIASWVLRRIERRIVGQGRATAQAAALVRKWILFIVTAVLALIALLSANIPLTAFAFLGGALAIAAGFGLQTLLKNLVSGVMLLIERPLRLGDLVEVDGIRGRVTEIGIRASTIRSADGIESMIPNSRFVEGNMTNWTYSSAQARQTIAVGVAYGSSLRDVDEILAGVLDRHGLVLKEPKPQVYLDAYGDSSINFSLTYWVEMNEGADVRRVKSDLLHMIDRSFAEAGISIPFPQRDVRLSTVDPVPVAIVGSSGMRSAA